MKFDHIIYYHPDLEKAEKEFEEKLGIKPERGGRHLNLGTHNSLFALGPRSYFEILSPDPTQEKKEDSPIRNETVPRIMTWVLQSDSIENELEGLRDFSCDFGGIIPMVRKDRFGNELSWKMTLGPDLADTKGVVPFLIQWKDLHPAETSPQGCSVKKIAVSFPEAQIQKSLLEKMIHGLDVDVSLKEGEPQVSIELETPKGVMSFS